MKSIGHVKKCIDLVRYDKPFNSLPFLLISLVMSLGVINSCLVIINEQDNVEKCLVALEEIAINALLFVCIVDRGLNPYKGEQLVNLLESEFLIDGYKLESKGEKWKKLEQYYEKKTFEMKKLSHRIAVAILLMYCGGINRNIFNEILVGRSKNVNQDWPKFFIYWSPMTTLNSFAFFVYMYCFQGLVLLFCSAEMYCVVISLCLGTERVLADYKTIGFLLNELEKDFPVICTSDGEDSNGNYVKEDLERLRQDMGCIVRCHQILNRNFKKCADNSAFPILMITCSMCIDTCMNIYIMLQADDLETIINYAVICVFINFTVFFSYNTGQQISNQSDVFRRSLANVPWIGKPKWFKQALVMMMQRSNIEAEMKPYGIYVLNYLSFKDVSFTNNYVSRDLFHKKSEGSSDTVTADFKAYTENVFGW